MYQAIRNAVNDDMDAVDHSIVEQLHSQVPLVENIGHYIVAAGGKRLRPILVLLVHVAAALRPLRLLLSPLSSNLSIQRPCSTTT